MVPMALLAHAWGLTLIGLLSLPQRTIHRRTIALAFGVGFGIVAPMTLMAQQLWMRLYARLAAPSPLYYLPKLDEISRKSGYTLDPFIEEIVKILPIILLLAMPRVSRRIGLTDMLVLGAALGAGFGFAEETMRLIYWIPQGGLRWDVTRQAWALPIPSVHGDIYVPGVFKILSQWIPNPWEHDPISFRWLGRWWELHSFNHHLIWSALAGLGVGLLFRVASPLRYLGGLLWLWVSLDHVFVNLVMATQPVEGLAIVPAVASLLTGFGRWAPLELGVALGIALWIDVQASRRALQEAPALRLPEEQRHLMAGTWLAFLSRPRSQWKGLAIFLRERNGWAYQRAWSAGPGPGDPLRDALIQAAVSLSRSSFPPSSFRFPSRDSLSILSRRPEVWAIIAGGIWISALPVAYFVAASTPGLKGIRWLFLQGAFFPVLTLSSILTLLSSALSLVVVFLSWRHLPSRVGGGRIVPLVLWGLMASGKLLLNLMALLWSARGPQATLLSPHISDAAAGVLMAEFLLFGFAVAAFVFGVMELPLLAFAFSIPGMTCSLSEAITGKDFLTGRPLSARDRWLAALDVLFGFLDLAPPRMARLFRVLEETRPRRVWTVLRRSAESMEESLSLKQITTAWGILSLEFGLQGLQEQVWETQQAYLLYQLDHWESKPSAPSSYSGSPLERTEKSTHLKQYRGSEPSSPSGSPLEQTEFRMQEVRTSIEKGDLLLIQGDAKEALRAYQEALSLAMQTGDLNGQAEAWSGIGEAMLRLHRSEEANRALDQALHLYRQLSIHGAPLAHLLTLAAEARQRLGDLEAAHTLVTEALQEAQALPVPLRDCLLQWMTHRLQEIGLLQGMIASQS